MESLPLFILLGVMVVGMLFMSSRSRKQQAKQSDFRNTLVPGQQVMTSSGQLGEIVSVDGDAVTIETTPGVYTRWVKAAIQAVPPQYSSTLAPEESEELDSLAGDDEVSDAVEPGDDADEGRPERPGA